MISGSSMHAMIRTAPPHAGQGLDKVNGCEASRGGALGHVDPDQIARSDLEQPQAGPRGGGQDARSNTRFSRCAQLIAARRSGGVGPSVSPAS
jgi:hypothetical protein